MHFTYNKIYKLAEYGRRQHGWDDYPLRLAMKKVKPHLRKWDMAHLEHTVTVGA
jgi:hypothetical protein